MRQNRRTVIASMILAVALMPGSGFGQPTAKDKAPSLEKMGTVLSALYDEYQAHRRRSGDTEFSTSNSGVRLVEDRVVVDAVASGDTAVLRADLETLGLVKAASFGRTVSGQLPIAALADADALESLQFARSAAAATRR